MARLASAEARLPSRLKHRGGGMEIFRKLGYRNPGTFEKINMVFVFETGMPHPRSAQGLLTTVKTGSFAAARALNRATSAVSYEPRDRATKGEGARRRTQL